MQREVIGIISRKYVKENVSLLKFFSHLLGNLMDLEAVEQEGCGRSADFFRILSFLS